jgi:mRNA interferase RelE/StbE
LAYTLRYHPRVLDEDLKRLAPAIRRRIERAIGARLAVAPQRYGVPLAGPLRGHSKLRVGDYRVVFRTAGDDILVVAILHRRDVYERAERRLDL